MQAVILAGGLGTRISEESSVRPKPMIEIRSWLDCEHVLPKMFSHKGPVICEVFTHPNQLFVPKLSLASQKDGSIAFPPLEDLSSLLSRSELEENMLVGMHLKSKEL